MTNLSGQIASVPGAPSSVRVGRVVSINPVVIDLGGTLLGTDKLGFNGSFMPMVGQSVSLLGQSSTPNRDPASWIVLGVNAPTPAAGLAPQAGSQSLSFGPATGFVSPVAFPLAYDTAPTVTTNIATAPASTAGWNSRAINITAVGFDIFVFGTSNTWVAVPVQWQAIPLTS